eukprot:1179755-Prorocentrum_minimum.AAC.3
MVIAPFRDVQSPWTRRAPCRVIKTEWRARHGSKGRPASSCAARTANKYTFMVDTFSPFTASHVMKPHSM